MDLSPVDSARDHVSRVSQLFSLEIQNIVILEWVPGGYVHCTLEQLSESVTVHLY